MSRNPLRWTTVLIAMAAVSLSIPRSAVAEERQFLVILAHSPKQFGGGFPPGGLTNPNLIDTQYFDSIPDNDIDSFLEYWEEISYGDVRISGSFQKSKTTDWVILPWSIAKQSGTEGFVDLNETALYEFGASERFEHDRAMSIVDLDGDPGIPPIDNGPFTSLNNPSFAQGGNDTAVVGGAPVWMPGERFVDMDGDGRWDALDEASNQMDFFKSCAVDSDCTGLPGTPVCNTDRQLCTDRASGTLIFAPDGRPDLFGPWIDLDGSGDANNEGDCVFLPDSDNDGNPDCCPDGPDLPLSPTTGCEPFPDAGACPATTWTDEDGDPFVDCNGNMIDDAMDIFLDPNIDVSPMTDDGGACVPNPDGIPDECQFTNASLNSPGPGCIDPAAVGICTSQPCVDIFPDDLRETAERCEFDDSNGNGVLDIVEPFENFLRRWDTEVGEWIPLVVPVCVGGAKAGQLCTANADCAAACVLGTNDGNLCTSGCPGGACLPAGTCNTSLTSIANRAYIVNNYPGTDDLVLGLATSRVLLGDHGDGTKKSAGQHAQFDSPDFWTEVGTTKMYNIDPADRFRGGEFLIETTAEPPWFAQAWVDRYDTAPPAWNSFGGSVGAALTPRMIPIEASRRCFSADQGGVNGDGIGWVGCGDFDPSIDFETSIDCAPGDAIPIAFDQACPPARILPEEIDGVGTPLTLFDGPREFDDLPSSKYHRGGDERLGEVTSPFNEDIWGHDLGPHGTGIGAPDKRLPAAGPYATQIHGNFGRDAGNLLLMELLTLLDGTSLTNRTDTNLDGMVDQGEIRNVGSENYITEPDGEGNGTNSDYPWNRRRLVEDCIEILDAVIDFEDFVDRTSLEQVECVSGTITTSIPAALQGGAGPGNVAPDGVLSGIVLLPVGAPAFPFSPAFYPIHNEDGLDTVAPPSTNLPRAPTNLTLAPGAVPQISWNLFFHDLVTGLDADSQSGTIPTGGFQTAFSAHEYLHTWEGFPDLYDYDQFDEGVVVNCPIGAWDIMASGGLVHPVPILKEKTCTGWTDPVDLTSVLTPGVDTTLTLPPAEFVRDESYYFLENEARPGERYYFWSAGHPDSLDARMPGAGMLVLHTDIGPNSTVDSNPDAVSQRQRSGTRPGFLIVQADGNNDLQACSTGGNRGDDADPWPGSTQATRFNFDTVPSATWYTQNSWTGIDIIDVVPDQNGSVQLTINWVPTSIPSLRFVDPPGGQSVGDLFQVRFEATDVFGGTEVRVFYTLDEKKCGGTGTVCTFDTDCATGVLCLHDLTMSAGNLVGSLFKTTPGTNRQNVDWNFSAVPDGRYVLFAKLNPGVGADGTEAKNTKPRAGRNNKGNGTLTLGTCAVGGARCNTDVDCTTGACNVASAVNIDADATDTDDTARLETWTVTCIDPAGIEFLVTSSLSQPDSLADPPPTAATASCADAMIACTSTTANYTSPGGEVTFRLTAGATPFELDDSFTFTTTGITSPSQPFSIIDGKISAGPIAQIGAAPLSGLPPLEVEFDATSSIDPNGEPLSFRWNFGDDTEEILGSAVSHTFVEAGVFSVRMTATNPISGRFDEATVDILVVNNSPTAAFTVTPASGVAPLTAQFDAANSSDSETPASELIYQWDFGDGKTGNDQGLGSVQGVNRFITTTHVYSTDGNNNNRLCTQANSCTFFAFLTVTDALGKSSTSDAVTILVGNSKPVASVTVSTLEGPAPLTVEFNAINSSDPDPDDDADSLTVTWDWGDATPDETHPLKGNVDDSGLVLHKYTAVGTFTPTATIKDGHGGEDVFTGGLITVGTNQAPEAKCTVTLSPFASVGIVKETLFTFNASGSKDPDGETLTYEWDFDDGSAKGDKVRETHTFQTVGTFDVKLTVSDGTTLPDTDTCRVTVQAAVPNQAPVALIATGLRICAATCTLTFDGSLSRDPDGDDLVHNWAIVLDDVECQTTLSCPSGFNCESDACVARRTEERVNVQFQRPGNYTVELTVTDPDGLFESFGPRAIQILEPETIFVPDPGADRPTTLTDDPPSSASQRPRGLCGFGVVTSFVGSLFGLTAMSIGRRRNRRRSTARRR